MAAAAQIPVTLTRHGSSLEDSDHSTRQTVQLMAQHIKEAVADPVVQKLAREVRQRWALGGTQQTATAWAIFWFEKHAIRFRSDEWNTALWLNETDQVDSLMSPRVMARCQDGCTLQVQDGRIARIVRMDRPEGDCDEFAMLACALLLANGIGAEIVTLACDSRRRGKWSHVYARAVLSDGRRMAIDATPSGEYPGWEVPDYDVTRRQVWDMNGNPVADIGAGDMRMHNYVRSGRRGMGYVDPETGLEATFGGGDTGGIFGGITGGQAGQASVWGGGPATGSGSGFNWNNFANMLGNIGSRLGTLAMVPRGGYYTVSPTGAQVFSNTGLPAAAAGSGNLIFWGIAGLAGLALVMAIAGGKK